MLSDGFHNYAYNADGMLTSVDSGAATYQYSSGGERIRKNTAAGSTEYVYFGGNAIAERNVSTGGWTNYIFFNGKRLVRRDPSGAVHYYLGDHLGSTSIVVSASGAIENESEFYPFGGELQFSAADSANHYKFTGKERDAESNLDYFGARHFSRTLGRFIIPDWSSTPSPVPYAKLGDPQSLNLYSYVENNPINGIDAEGHTPELISFTRHNFTPYNNHGDGGSGYEPSQIDTSGWAPPPPSFQPYRGCRMCAPSTDPSTAASMGKLGNTTVSVRVNNRIADIPGGEYLSAYWGLNHQFLTTSEGVTVGMGTMQGVPRAQGLGDTLRSGPLSATQVVDHTGQVPLSSTVFTGLDKAALDSYLALGAPTGRWVPGLNDCNTWAANVIYQSTPHDIYGMFLEGSPFLIAPNAVVYADGTIHSAGEQK